MDDFIETGYGYTGIGYFLKKQEWIMYMYGLIETGYGYSGMRLILEKEDWILYMDYRNSIWIQRNMIFSGKPKLDDFIGTGCGYYGIEFFSGNQN